MAEAAKKLQDYGEITIEQDYTFVLDELLTSHGLVPTSENIYNGNSVSVFVETKSRQNGGLFAKMVKTFGYEHIDTYVWIRSIDKESGKELYDLIDDTLEKTRTNHFNLRSLFR
jgi:hypothetical protein